MSAQTETIITEKVRNYLTDLHARLVNGLQDCDGKAFRQDPWEHRPGGGGLTCVIEEGGVFERACASFSDVYGVSLPMAATAAHPKVAGEAFEMMGTSSILHPWNPHIPTVHMNVRFLHAKDASGSPIWWFGGGMDLTPYYGYPEDAVHFHTVCRDALRPFGEDLYPRFKKNCDAYFFNRYRQEPRGIGGIFFDDYDALGFGRCLEMIQSVGDHFLKAYLPIVEKRRSHPYTPEERHFQAYRRGRYVEFNLTHDRGTRFGLELGGRLESIMASLPPRVEWRYDWKPAAGSREEKLSTDFLIAKDWLENS